jgi:hypothetical protein
MFTVVIQHDESTDIMDTMVYENLTPTDANALVAYIKENGLYFGDTNNEYAVFASTLFEAHKRTFYIFVDRKFSE